MDYLHMVGAKRVIAVAGVAALAASAACANILDIDSDRHLAGTDAGSGGGADRAVAYGMWGCLGLPAGNANPTASLDVTVGMYNAIDPTINSNQVDGGSSLNIVSGTPLAGATIK